jgi:hypothetical protein
LSQSDDLQLNDYRHELKMPLQRLQFAEFESWLRQSGQRLEKQFPDRQIHSVYLDTAELDDYQDNVAGISQRGKQRLRWYDEAPEDMVLEFKNKSGRLANKLVVRLSNPAGELPLDRQSAERLLRSSERSELLVRQQHLFPSLHVQYHRSYYELSPGIRMTLDRHIRYQKLYPVKSHAITASVVDVVVEFKYPVDASKRATELLVGMPGRIFRHSKYVVGVDTVCDL